jgi:hypothetical protein
MKRFAVAGEGLTDFIVIRNLLIGFFNEKNLPITRLLPENKEAFGWGNLFDQLSKDRFRAAFEFIDYVVVQVDSGTCDEWKEGLTHIGDDESLIEELIKKIVQVLITKIGEPFYSENKSKIIFAVAVHDIECWLLLFNATKSSDKSKLVNCTRSVEQIAQKRGFSIHQKNYQGGKNYDDLSKEMTKNKQLMSLYEANPSLKIFIDSMLEAFPDDSSPS